VAVDDEAVETAAPAQAPASAPAPAAAPAPAPAATPPAAAQPAPASPAPTVEQASPAAAPAAAPAPPAASTGTTPEEAGAEEGSDEEETTEEAAPAETPAPAPAQAPAPAPAAVVAPAQAAAPAVAPETGKEEEAVEEGEVPVEVETPAAAMPAPVAKAKEPEVQPEPEPEAPAVEEKAVAEEPEMAVEEESVAEMAPPEPEPVIEAMEAEVLPTIAWNPRQLKGAFADFLEAGSADMKDAAQFPSHVLRVSGVGRMAVAKGDEVVISGTYRRGQVLAAYHVDSGVSLSRYVGLVSVTAPAGTGASRATIIRSRDAMWVGDSLQPIEDVQESFASQRETSARPSAYPVVGRVERFGDGTLTQLYKDSLLVVNRGSRDGVGLAWLCELIVPGKATGTTYGRVVRADRYTCFVRPMKIYQPVQAGDQVRLSVSPLAGKSARSRAKR